MGEHLTLLWVNLKIPKLIMGVRFLGVTALKQENFRPKIESKHIDHLGSGEKMNNLYRMELMPMLSDLDADLEKLFKHYGFYESDKLTMKDFKGQIIKDYGDIFIKESEK